MKSMILYGSPKKLSRGHKPIFCGTQVYFVRAEVVPVDFETALDKAKPRDGETVLNTVPIGGAK